MEFVEGQTLDRLIGPHGAAPNKVLNWSLQIADALVMAHEAGIVHGDLKPLNIMVTPADRVKTLDFGLASIRTSDGEHVSTSKDRFGTTVFMAPEQLTDPPIAHNPLSEIFAFGLIVHHMLTGKHPFASDQKEKMLQAIRLYEPPTLPLTVPTFLSRIVEICLQKRPEQRFQSALDLLAALRESEEKEAPRPVGPTLDRQRPAAKPSSSAKITLLLQRITYDNVAKTRQAVSELAPLLRSGLQESARDEAIEVLKDLIVTQDPGHNEISRPVRIVRQLIFSALKFATRGQFSRYFRDQALEQLDLYGIDFSNGSLHTISFRQSFVVESTFENSDLSGSNFDGAWIRNVNVAGANLTEADVTDADWFNTTGLTESQLRSVQGRTLLACPPDIAGLHEILDARYGFAFKSWSTHVQKQILQTWSECLRPGGLRDVADECRRNSF
jgi:serine/threonine protein kinase